jgi:ELWxxDGT repeat protein
MIVDIIPGSVGSAPRGMAKVLANRVVFTASSASAGGELWTTDGTAVGTAQIQDIAPGAASSNPASFTVVNTDIFFVADDGSTGRELWQVASTAVTNHPPVASGGVLAATCGARVTGTLSATDLDGDPLTFSLVQNGSKGVAAITNPATGTFTYTPSATCSSGTDTFTFVVNDGAADSNVGTITVNIRAQAPQNVVYLPLIMR